MNPFKLNEYLAELNLPAYRFSQIKNFVQKKPVKNFSDITTIPKELREKLDKKFKFYSLVEEEKLISRSKDSIKFLFKLKDSNYIESVCFEREKNSWAVCISTQVGCPVGCVFCMSGRKGLKRNLNWEEISDQVLYVRNYILENNLGDLRKVVYMGIGEPLLNYSNVIESLKIINEFFGIGKRNISVSTFGYVPRIRDFAKDMPQVNLAVSLHSAIQEKRDKLVPLSHKFNLIQLARAMRAYIEITRRKIFIEYVMLDGINDREKDARRLYEYLKSVESLKYFTVNLIPYNTTFTKFRPPSKFKIDLFKNILLSYSVETTVRKSFGQDIKGACGQLAVVEKSI